VVGAEVAGPYRAGPPEPSEPEEERDQVEYLKADNERKPMPATHAHGRITMYREERRYQGPLPDPATLEEYKRVDPRFPDAILNAFQEQSSHRHEMERKLLEGSERRANRGQWLGTGLLVAALAGGVWVTLAGHPVVGGATVAASLAVGVVSYVFGDYRQKRD